jgi:glucose/mannose-6-phosphate isomerase
MFESIKNFAKQFDFTPEIKNGAPVDSTSLPQTAGAPKIIVAGMGGSHLAADLLRLFEPTIDVYVHRDYGLPPLGREILKESFLVASSYSGNTEETLDFTREALKDGFRPTIITSGGKLLEFAEQSGLPYVKIPDTVIQPRVALGLSLLALSYIAGARKLYNELKSLSSKLSPASLEKQGKAVALQLFGKIPLFYSSERNLTVAYNWKIKINETAKVPAFCHALPEFNHNEMAGFSSEGKNAEPKAPFQIVFLRDRSDHPRIAKRMDITTEMLSRAGMSSNQILLEGETLAEKIFNSLLAADWTAYHLALMYKTDPDTTPVIKEFKDKMTK